MADEPSKPHTKSRRDRILSFIPKGRQQDDARRLFDALDRGEPPAPRPPSGKRDSERKK